MSIVSKAIKAINEGRFLKSASKGLNGRIKKEIKRIKVSTGDLLYFLNNRKLEIKNKIEGIQTINEHHYKAGNYYLDSRIPINSESVIYSFGIGGDVSFDDFVSKKFGCSVFMYDPTPSSIAYMKKKHANNTFFKFFPFGVWTENTTLRFYMPELGGSSSALNKNGNEYFDAECYTFARLLELNKHKKVDVFKADIEGAALPVLEQMIEQSIYPRQIVVELEAPSNQDDKQFSDFLNRVSHLMEVLKKTGYESYNLPRDRGLYSSFELLFVRISSTN